MLFVWCMLLLIMPLAAGAEPVPVANPRDLGPAVIVGSGQVPAGDVLELWSPVWYETLARVRNGKMSAADGDARLTQEWRRIVTSLVKDELFFQEAEREHSSMINNIAEQYMRSGYEGSRSRLVQDIRNNMNMQMERYFRQFNADMIKESGGMVKLLKVLEGRGLSFAQWQQRLKKKAFTQSYLGEIIRPRAPDPGPRQIREYYAGHDDEFQQPGLVRFKHIFFSNTLRGKDQARADALAVWERVANNEMDFEAAVAEYSDDDVSKAHGGLESGAEATDPEREAWLADVRAALREEPPGDIAPILESPFGCHIAFLIDIGPPTKIPFTEVRRDIERKLRSQIWEDATDEYFRQVSKNVPIQIVMRDFPSWLSCASQTDSRHKPQVIQMAQPEVLVPAGGR